MEAAARTGPGRAAAVPIHPRPTCRQDELVRPRLAHAGTMDPSAAERQTTPCRSSERSSETTPTLVRQHRNLGGLRGQTGERAITLMHENSFNKIEELCNNEIPIKSHVPTLA